MAKPFRKQIDRLQSRQQSYDSIRDAKQRASFVRPGSMNARKGTFRRSKRG